MFIASFVCIVFLEIKQLKKLCSQKKIASLDSSRWSLIELNCFCLQQRKSLEPRLWQRFNIHLFANFHKIVLFVTPTNVQDYIALIILIKNGFVLSGCSPDFPALKIIIIFTLVAHNVLTSLRWKSECLMKARFNYGEAIQWWKVLFRDEYSIQERTSKFSTKNIKFENRIFFKFSSYYHLGAFNRYFPYIFFQPLLSPL